MLKNCIKCGAEYETKTGRAKYCMYCRDEVIEENNKKANEKYSKIRKKQRRLQKK
jgi:uncharacterized Zn ribbon protein